LSQALTPSEKSDLGIRIYDASPANRSLAMMPWEEAWLARRLPAPPARILVGACGAGRELQALASRGYTVDAFEPAPSLARDARARLGDRARVFVFRYEELSAALLDGRDGPAAALAGERYDAVLLGWGSLTHVLDESERLRLFRVIDRLCPRGPLLASFWCDQPVTTVTPALDRAQRVGAAAGRVVARMRNLCTAPSPREIFALHSGFAYRYTRSELEALAASVARTMIWERDDTDYPHASFVT
jgi:hypothetical protein